MPHHQPGRRQPILLTAAIVGLLVVVLLACGQRTGAESTPRRQDVSLQQNVPGEPPGRLQSRTLGAADGEVADGTTVLADVPAVTKLDSALRAALRLAADDAAAMGVELDVNSGWRSYAYQKQLFEQAVAEHGSAADAERWVARPGTSVHEAGDAVDIGPASAATWLANHGGAFGLCQVYDNEPWHYELHPDAVDDGCPATYADPTRDPRMRP
jgi:hypothetical protein